MEFDNIIRIIWIVNFFFFSLALIFVWAKMLIIARRLKGIAAHVTQSKELAAQYKLVMAAAEESSQ